MRRFVAGVIFLCLAIAGCTHYKLGHPSESLPFERLYVKPIVNKSFAPQAQALLTDQLIQSLQREASIIIVQKPEDADATLEVVLTEYTRTTLATKEDDTFLASTFLLELTAECSLMHNMLTVVYFYEKPVSSTLNARVGESLQASEYQNMPILTRELALKIKNLVITAW